MGCMALKTDLEKKLDGLDWVNGTNCMDECREKVSNAHVWMVQPVQISLNLSFPVQ